MRWCISLCAWGEGHGQMGKGQGRERDLQWDSIFGASRELGKLLLTRGYQWELQVILRCVRVMCVMYVHEY